MRANEHMRAYLDRGWSVVPLQPRSKEPFPGFALDAYMRARADRFTLKQWAQRWPDANIGVITGSVSGIFVVDCDSQEAFQALRDRGIPDTLTARTQAGRHLYFALPDDFKVGHAHKALRAALGGVKVDVRGERGYVVAPPSIHPSGHVYAWENDLPPAPAPGWLLDVLRGPATAPPQPGNGAAGEGCAARVIRAPVRFAERAIHLEAAATLHAPKGDRNNTLNAAAFNLGQLVGAGVADRLQVEAQLLTAALGAGLDERAARATIASGLNAGMATPRKVVALSPSNGGREKTSIPAREGEDSDSLTELGNAKRLVKRWGNRIRYFSTKGKWLIWDGTRWQTDETGGVMRAAKDVVMNLYRRAAGIEDPDRRKDYLKWAMASESRNRLESMVHLARTEKRVIVRAEDLDQNGWLLNCRNCTIDLKTGAARDHSPADMLTRRIGVTYDPKARAPRWLKFLGRIMRDDQEMIDFLQRAIGYTLTGDVSEQCLFFLYGHGRNGKSTFVETMLKLLDEYAIKTPTETLMMRDNKAATNDLARLYGMRAVVAKETDEGQRLAEAVIKDLTGGDKITARFLYQEFFEFRPSHKLWMYGNHKPIVRGSDFGIWRRIRLIPFAVTIPEDERDPRLRWRLEEELPGILNWALEGCLKWQHEGLGSPKVILAATEEYREEMDVLGEFLQECCVIAPDGRLTAALLYTEYSAWCARMGEQPISKRALGLRMKERGFTQYREGAARMWEGLKLRSMGETIPM